MLLSHRLHAGTASALRPAAFSSSTLGGHSSILIAGMELRHLRYFIGVAEDLNFSRAAERLHVAQSALSRQVQDLEGELGVQLFVRDKRGVLLTTAGKTFLTEARRGRAPGHRLHRRAV